MYKYYSTAWQKTKHSVDFVLQKGLSEEKPLISGKNIAFFVIGTLAVAVLVSSLCMDISPYHESDDHTIWTCYLV